MNESISRSIYQSLAADVALIFILAVRGYIAPTQPIHLPEAIRGDVVGLPEKEQRLPEKEPEHAAKQPEKRLPPKATPKPKPLPDKPKVSEAPKVNLNKTEKKVDTSKAQKAAFDKINEMAALDKIQNDVA